MLPRVSLSVSPGYAPRLKTTWIRYFIVCCRSGHIADAAKELGISTQALNRNLNALERLVDQSLFTRSRGHLALTAAGRRFEVEAALLLQDIESLSEAFRPDAEAVTLSLGWSQGWEHAVLSDILSQTMASLSGVFPSIRHVRGQSRLEAAVLDRELDIALACRRPEDPRLNSLLGRPIPYVIVSKPQARRHWSQFRYSVLLDATSGRPEPLSWDESVFPRSRSLESDSLMVCLEMSRQGFSAACLPLSLVEPWLQSRELAIVAETPVPLYLTPCLFWAGELSEQGQAVLNALLKEIA